MNAVSVLFLVLFSALCPSEAHPSNARSLRIVVVGLQATSHINQLQGLAQELQRRGHDVSIVVNDEKKVHVQGTLDQGAKFISAGMMPHPEEYYGYTQTLPEFLSCIRDVSISAYDACHEEVKRLRPDVVIYDACFPAGQALAELTGATPVPVSLGTVYLVDLGTNAFTKPMVVSGFGPNDIIESPPALLQNTIMTWAAYLAVQTLRFVYLRPFWQHTGLTEHQGWTSYPKGRIHPMLSASVPGFEYPRKDGPLVQYAGPLLPRAEAALPDTIARFMDKASKGVVLVSIGTNAMWTTEWATTFFEGIKRLPEGVHVVWATKKWQQDKFMPFAKSLPSHILLVDWVPQLTALAHAHVKVFVTHCGYSSVQESVWHGVPMVGMAGMLESDQPTICSTLRDYGLGLRLVRGKDELTATTVSDAITRVLSNTTFRENVETWRRRFVRQGGAATAADMVEGWAIDGYTHLVLPDDESSVALVWSLVAGTLLPLIVVAFCCRVVARCCCGRRPSKVKGE